MHSNHFNNSTICYGCILVILKKIKIQWLTDEDQSHTDNT